jgi:hypothetical protein
MQEITIYQLAQLIKLKLLESKTVEMILMLLIKDFLLVKLQGYMISQMPNSLGT